MKSTLQNQILSSQKQTHAKSFKTLG